MVLSSHQQRIVTALLMLPLVGLALVKGGWYVFFMTLVICLLGLWEFYSMFWPNRSDGLGKKIIGLVLAVIIFYAARLQNPYLMAGVMVLSYWIGNMFYLVCYSKRPDETQYVNAAVLVAGLMYLPMTLQFFLYFTPAESVLVLLSAAASDTGAYYAGNLFGTSKIWPQISPKKTWKGSAGGMAVCVIASMLFGKWFGHAPMWAFAGLGVLLNISGQFGDFFESALKRRQGVKDSGSILPGHGGILDRIDALLLIIPVYAAVRALYPFFQ